MSIEPPQPEDFLILYRRAFAEYGTRALWHKRFLRILHRKMLLSWRGPCASRATARPAAWRNRSSRPAVPLSKIQSGVLRLLASHRDPESYVAGGTPLNRDAPRYSATSTFSMIGKNVLRRQP